MRPHPSPWNSTYQDQIKRGILMHKQFSACMQTLLPSSTTHTATLHNSKPPPPQVRDNTDSASLPALKAPPILNYPALHTSHLLRHSSYWCWNHCHRSAESLLILSQKDGTRPCSLSYSQHGELGQDSSGHWVLQHCIPPAVY